MPILLSTFYLANYLIIHLTRSINQKCFSDIVVTCTKDVFKIFDANNEPQIRDNNLIHGNDEGVPILMSLTVHEISHSVTFTGDRLTITSS